MKRIIRCLLPAISIIVFAWAYQGEGDLWLHSFFYGCFVTFMLLLPSYIKLGKKGYICFGLVLWFGAALFLWQVKDVSIGSAVGWSVLFAIMVTLMQFFMQNIIRLCKEPPKN